MKAQFEHHEEAVETLTRQVEDESLFDALILAGSVPRGTARPDSDIDCYVLVDDDEYQRRKAVGDLAWITWVGDADVFVDGKIINEQILRDAAERGSEPMRASFASATVAYSRIGKLSELVGAIAVYPEANRVTNLQDFFASASLHASYFGPQALKTGNSFLLSHATTMAVLFGGRAVLAHNRILYPCPKQLLATVERAVEQPADFVDTITDLLDRPSEELFARLLEQLQEFTDWGISDAEVLTRFMELDEWSWHAREPELAQR